MSADNLLSKLDKVKRTGKGTWTACCPAHADKGPSLNIRETDDGKVLVRCFAECSVHEILDAVGLEISDLFPPRQHHGKPERRPFPAVDVLRCIAFEALIVITAARSIANGEALGSDDYKRLLLAAERIQRALTAAGVNHG